MFRFLSKMLKRQRSSRLISGFLCHFVGRYALMMKNHVMPLFTAVKVQVLFAVLKSWRLARLETDRPKLKLSLWHQNYLDHCRLAFSLSGFNLRNGFDELRKRKAIIYGLHAQLGNA